MDGSVLECSEQPAPLDRAAGGKRQAKLQSTCDLHSAWDFSFLLL